MKALALLSIILLLAISPIFFEDAFAHHVNRFSGGTYDDDFYWQEIDNTQGNCVTNDYKDGAGFRIDSGTTTTGTSNTCAMFKVFDKEDVNNKLISVTGVWSRTNGFSNDAEFQIWDGAYMAGNSTDFPANLPQLTKGAGKLFDIPSTSNPPTNLNPRAFDLSASTQSQVTIFFGSIYDNSNSALAIFRATSINIQDLGTWDFCFSPSTDCDTARPVTEQGSGELEYGVFYSYNPDTIWVKGADVTDLSVTVLNNTQVRFDWTEINDAGTGIQDINVGLNVTGYHLEYKNGTSNQSDFWTMGNSTIGDIETTKLNAFEAGHSYTARLLTVGNDDWLSEPSNEVTFTMTGTSASTQTFDTKFEKTTGIDSRFYYREANIENYVGSGVAEPWKGECTTFSYLADEVKGTISDPETGTCFLFLKVFPTSTVIDKEWKFTGTFHRSVAQVYHEMYVFDGAYDVYNSTLFTHGKPLLELGGGRIYDNAVPVTGVTTFTPTGATEDFVTFAVYLEDNDTVGDDVTASMAKLEIAGVETFFIPTSSLQSTYPIVNYITNTEHDWGWVNSLYTPLPVVLSVAESGDNALLTWTDPNIAGSFALEPTGFQIQKECPSGGGWQILVADAGDVLTYTDTNFLSAVGILYSETFDDDVEQPNWVSTDDEADTFITYHSATDQLLFDIRADSTDLIIYYTLSETLSDSQWVMDYKINFSDLTTGSATNYFFFGVGDDEFQSVPLDTVDAIGFMIIYSGGTHNLYLYTKNGATANQDDTGYNFVDEDTDFYIRIARTSTTSTEMSLYATTLDEDNKIFTYTQTDTNAGITALDNIMGTSITSPVSNEKHIEGGIDNLRLGNNASYMQEAGSTSCNYRVIAINELGNSSPSNEASLSQAGVSLTSPDSLNAGTNGQNSCILTWDYSGAETASGFRIDGETPVGGGFTQYVSNTQSTSTSHTVTGLSAGLTYDFKVAVIVGADTSGFSGTSSCITQSASGGGSSSTSPSTPITTTDPETGEETVSGEEFVTTTPSTPISSEQSDLFDLSFPLIQELTNTFSGDIFTLIGGTHFAGLGQTITGNLLIGWDNTDNIIVSSMIIADSQMDITPIPFPPYVAEGGAILSDNEIEQLSIIPPDLPNIKSHQLLPYEIVIPNAFCGTGIFPCVEAGTHKIPIKVISTQGGENIANNARIDITIGMPQIQLDIPTFVMFALVAIGIVGAIQVARRFKKKKTVHV